MKNRENFYAVIMAGGKGERFWPQSRAARPKQLLNILGDKTLIEQAVERILPVIREENVIIITNKLYVEQIKELLPGIPEGNIVGEPVGKDTAPCIALATAIAESKSGKDENPVLAVMPADHIIRNQDEFCRILAAGADVAETAEQIVTIGITPTEPSTGYGYIKFGEKYDGPDSVNFYYAEKFYEKPDYDTAVEFLNSGMFKWNSGMFIFSAETIHNAFRKFMPEMAEGIEKMVRGYDAGNFESQVLKFFEGCRKISIDYAVMEKADNILVAESTFDWDDAGSWTALKKHIKRDKDGNAVIGKFASVNSKNCIVSTSDEHLVALVGVENLVVVHTEDATLVCREDDAQQIKTLVQKLSTKSETKEYL